MLLNPLNPGESHRRVYEVLLDREYWQVRCHSAIWWSHPSIAAWSRLNTVVIRFLRNILIGLSLSLGLSLVLYSAYTAVGNATNAAVTRQPLWSTELNANTVFKRGASPSRVLATDRQIFVSTYTQDFDQQTLRALDSTSGKLQWISKTPIRNLLTVEGTTVYASSDRGVVAIDASTGIPRTTIAFTKPNTESDERAIGIFQGVSLEDVSEIVDNRNPVNPIFQSHIFARTRDKLLWQFKAPLDALIGLAVTHGFVRPVIQDDILFLPLLLTAGGDRVQQFVGLEVATGKVLWTWKAPHELWSANILDDTIYASAFGNSEMLPSGWLKALDLKTGKERWSYTITGKAKAANDREVFVWQSKYNAGNHFVVLDKKTGNLLREFDLNREDEREPQGLLLAENMLYTTDLKIENATVGFYATADNHTWINAFDTATGRLVWHTPTLLHSHVHAPTISGQRLFVSSSALNEQGKNFIQAFDIKP